MPFAGYPDCYHKGMTASKVDWAWAAGFIDGEAHIRAAANKPSTRTSAHRQLMITVTQVDRRPLVKLREIFGGAVRGPYAENDPKRQPFYVWQLSSYRGVTDALAKMDPYLMVKREQADNAIAKYHSLDSVLAHRRVAETLTSECPLCGSAFEHPDYKARKFCSHSCAAKSRWVSA